MARPKIVNLVSVTAPGPILYGTLAQLRTRCGKNNCACHSGKSEDLHGPYYQWSGIVQGKHVTRKVSKEVAEECLRRINNYRTLLEKIDELKKHALEIAPWLVEHPP